MNVPATAHVPWSRRLTVRLTGGVILALLLIGVPFLLAFQKHLRDQQLESLARATSVLSGVVVSGLESSMLSGKPHLLDDTIRGLAEQPPVERVILADHEGRVRVTSDPRFAGRRLDREQESACRVCHTTSRARPSGSGTVVTLEQGRRVLRAMHVISNQPRCHRCHDPALATNGLLLMDLALSEADRAFFVNMGGTVALGSVMVVLTIAVLAYLLRRLVHAPLDAVVAASRRIVEGDLGARARVASPGEFGLLAERVNRMTDHLAQSLGHVEEKRRQLQEILEAADDEIVVLDRDQRIVAANRAFRRLGGRPEWDVTGQSCGEVAFDRFPCSADEPAACPVLAVLRTGRHQKGIRSRTGPDGREQVVEIHASPVLGADGTVTQVVEVRRDISERRRMEASLAQSERLASLGLLASGLSHEINNPLGAISASVDGLRRRLRAEPGGTDRLTQDLEKSLALVSEQVKRGRAITDRLLRVARPPAGSRDLVDVNAVVEDTLAILAHQISRARVVVRRELASDLPPVQADTASLGQVLMNLCLNSLQASAGKGGLMRMATSAVDSCIQVEVQDWAGGIPPAHVSRVFEPFFTTKPPGQGTGLGLFISHRLITEMGGTIQLHNEPGAGVLFTVRLPRQPARETR